MKCPGQDMQYWNAESIFEVECPQCHKAVEFYKDDPSRRCHHCGHRFVNPKMDFGCAAYCPFAEQCIGTLPEEFSGAKEALLKDKVAVEVKRMLGKDFHRIGHISRVARYTEQLANQVEYPLAVILCAAYLNIAPTGENGTEHPASVARDVLTRLKADETMIERVCSLLQHEDAEQDHARRVLCEAELLARLESAVKEQSSDLGQLTIASHENIHSLVGKQIMEELLSR